MSGIRWRARGAAATVVVALGCGGRADDPTRAGSSAAPAAVPEAAVTESEMPGSDPPPAALEPDESPPAVPMADSAAKRCPLGGALAEVVEGFEQASIDALEGCEQLESLLIWAPLDLRPLHALRRVEGVLDMLSISDLTGLEGLEAVGALRITSFRKKTLLGLSGLRTLGELTVTESDLEDDSAFRNVSGMSSITFSYNPNLRSLAALSTTAQVDGLILVGSPLLSDISAFRSVRSVRHLAIHDTALPDLDALENVVGSADLINLSQNPLLTNVGGLAGLRSVAVQFTLQCSGLTDASGLAGIESVGDLEFRFPALEQAQEFSQLTHAASIRLVENGGLGLSFPALTELKYLSIRDNAGLQAANFRALRKVSQFVDVQGNSALQDLNLTSLAEASSFLIIKNNPLLPAEPLGQVAANVSTLFQQVAGSGQPVPPDECHVSDCANAATDCGPYPAVGCPQP